MHMTDFKGSRPNSDPHVLILTNSPICPIFQKKEEPSVIKEKISPELFVAAVLSAVILITAGALSYASKNYVFIFAGLMTVVLSMPIAFHGNKL